MSDDDKSVKTSKSSKKADSQSPNFDSGFGWQLDSFTVPGSSTVQKAGTNAPDYTTYNINRPFVADSVEVASRSGGSPPVNRLIYQNFQALRDEHLRNGTLFEDPQFPAVMRSLYINSTPSGFDDVKWLRPKEIASAPQFFVNGFSKFDVIQGRLSDCWFLASVGSLTMHPRLFLNVVNDHDQGFGKSYAGIFYFKFWDYGKWVNIVIDDRLPVLNGQLVGASSTDSNEFWIALLEKAFAKFYGSYQAIEYGFAYEAFVDFTGGVGERFTINNFINEYQNNSFKKLLNSFERGSLMVAATDYSTEEKQNFTESLGIGVNHAYTITNLRYVQTSRAAEEVPLVRLRDPWGNRREWKGHWSDNSEDWNYVSDDVKKHIKLSFHEDGEFWMAWNDFTTHYSDFCTCSLTPDSKADSGGNKKRWETSIFKNEWVIGVNAGGNSGETFYRNPQYTITLTRSDENNKNSSCIMIVSLLQKHLRAMRPFGYNILWVTFNIYHIPNPDRMPGPPFDRSFFIDSQIIGHAPGFFNSIDRTCRFEFPPGTYLIVPYTKEPTEGSFVLRVISETKNYMKYSLQFSNPIIQYSKKGHFDDPKHLYEYDQTVDQVKIFESPISARMGTVKVPEVDESTQQMFLKHGGEELEITWLGLKKILDAAMMKETRNRGFSEDGCRIILALANEGHSNKLDYEDFKTLWIDLNNWKEAFELQDKESSGKLIGLELQEALTSMGFRINKHILIDLVHRYGDTERKFSFESFILCAIKIKSMFELFKSKISGKSNTVGLTLPQLLQNTIIF